METWGRVDRNDVEFPERIGPYSLAEVQDYDDVELGVRLKYTDSRYPHAVTDVYLYPISKNEVLSLTHVLEVELASTSDTIQLFAEQSGMTAGPPRFFQAGIGNGGDGGNQGLAVVRRLSSGSQELVTQGFVAVRDHRFFKIRATFPVAEVAVSSEEHLQAILDAFLPAIRLRPPVRAPEFGVTVHRNVFDRHQSESCNVAGWIFYGVVMKAQIERGNYLNTFERELAARTGVLDLFNEQRRTSAEACESDAVEAMARAREAGLLEEFVYVGYARSYWATPDGLDLDAWAVWAESNVEGIDLVVEPGVSVQWHDGPAAEAEPKSER